MKRLLLLFGMLNILFIVGCSPSTSSSNSTSKVAESKTEGVTLVGRDFAGTYTGKGTAEDPTYQYSMHFGKDGQFVQDIIATKGYAGRFTEKGTYTIDKKNKKIVMTIKEVTEERFANDTALAAGDAPTAFYEWSSSDSESPLNKAEDHPIDIKLGAKYLIGSVNAVKLYPTKKATVNYTKHYDAEKAKYTKSGGWVSGKTFGTGGILVSFKNGKFIFQYATVKDPIHTVASAEGDYTLSSNGQKIKLDFSSITPLYQGPKAEYYQYTTSTTSPFENVRTVNLTVISESELRSDAIGSIGALDLGSENAGDHYPSLMNQWSVANTKAKMQKVRNLGVTDIFPTVDDFAQWVLPIATKQAGYDLDILGKGTDVTDDDERVNTTFKYEVTYANPENAVPGIVGITEDGRLYAYIVVTQGRFMQPDYSWQEKYDALRDSQMNK